MLNTLRKVEYRENHVRLIYLDNCSLHEGSRKYARKQYVMYSAFIDL